MQRNPLSNTSLVTAMTVFSFKSLNILYLLFNPYLQNNKTPTFVLLLLESVTHAALLGAN